MTKKRNRKTETKPDTLSTDNETGKPETDISTDTGTYIGPNSVTDPKPENETLSTDNDYGFGNEIGIDEIVVIVNNEIETDRTITDKNVRNVIRKRLPKITDRKNVSGQRRYRFPYPSKIVDRIVDVLTENETKRKTKNEKRKSKPESKPESVYDIDENDDVIVVSKTKPETKS
jgi:hypothetical protein